MNGTETRAAPIMSSHECGQRHHDVAAACDRQWSSTKLQGCICRVWQSDRRGRFRLSAMRTRVYVRKRRY